MNRLLAFGASSTIAALLLMRILPELAADPEEKAEPPEPEVQAEMNIADTSVEEAPDSAATLLLPPPPPARKIPPPSEAQQATPPPQPEATIIESPSQAQPEIAEAVPSTEPIKTAIDRESDPLSEAAPTNKAAIEAAPPPRPRPTTDLVEEQAQTAAASSESTEIERDPSPRPDRAARAEDHIVSPGPTVEAEGRVLLRILEHGSGPEVEIAWPESAIQRRDLYRLFEACYGMEIAVMDSGGRLYGRAGEAGRPWQPNLDRYSGFVRQPSGRLTLDEMDSIARIRTFHGGLRAAENVRLFPRRLDALLLGGFKSLIGDGYAGASAIRAHYRRDGDTVLVEGIRLDGRPILGRIDLSAAARHCRSGAWS